MPNLAAVLREEILRLARREIRRQTNVLRKASVQYRRDIAEMKRRVSCPFGAPAESEFLKATRDHGVGDQMGWGATCRASVSR